MPTRTRLNLAARAVLLTLAAATLPAAPGRAEVERNPFTPPPAAERIEAAERDRVLRITKDIVRSEIGRLEKSIAETVERRLLSSVERRVNTMGDEIKTDMDTRLGAVEETVTAFKTDLPNQIANEIQRKAQTSAGTGEAEEGTAFVACVNGKALYRDQDGSTFYLDDSDPAADRCGG